MQTSPKRQRDLTSLEIEAQNLVNEPGDSEEEIEVNDDRRYEAMIASRKNRRAGECLYDFLERQVKEQMRSTMGQPLQNISSTVLNKVVSRDVQLELRKYKMDAQGSRRKRSASRGRDQGSPTVRFNDRGQGGVDISENKAVRTILKELDSGINDKVSLLRMLVIKFDESDRKMNQLRQCIDHGEQAQADRILSDMQACNGTMASDVTNESQDGPDLINLIGQLTQLLQAENTRSRSQGRSGHKNESAGRTRGGRSGSPLRSSLKGGAPDRDAAAAANERTDQLKRQILDLQAENDNLRRGVDDVMIRHHHELESKEQAIRELSSNLNTVEPGYSEAEVLLRKENDAFRQETRMLRDKVSDLSRDADELSRQRANGPSPSIVEALEREKQRLRADLDEYRHQVDNLRAQLNDNDSGVNKQKNEWAGIYGNMKRETEDLKRDIRMLNQENERLLRQVEQSKRGNGSGVAADAETMKRLKKRELECSALWETLRDMYIASSKSYSTHQMLELLQRRALHDKARRKLGLQ